jgi:DNA-binding transcriptional MerR regulator
MGGGFALIHRSIREQNWYRNPEFKSVFIELLLRSQFKTGKCNYKGMTLLVRRGQLFTCAEQLSKDTGVSVSQVKKALSLFKKLGQIDTQKISNKGNLITLLNYDKWQENSEPVTEPVTERVNEPVQLNTDAECSNISEPLLELVAELDAELQSNKVNKIDIYTPLTPQLAFKIFWAYYPKKSSKKPAMSKFLKLVRESKDTNQFLITVLTNILQRYKLQPSNWKSGNQFCLHPSTYLNQARYEDEILHEESNNEINTKSSQAKSQRVRSVGTTQSAAEAMEAVNNHFGSEPNHSFDMDEHGQDI